MLLRNSRGVQNAWSGSY